MIIIKRQRKLLLCWLSLLMWHVISRYKVMM